MFFQGLIFRTESSHQQQSEMATFPRHKRRVTITNACNGATASQVWVYIQLLAFYWTIWVLINIHTSYNFEITFLKRHVYNHVTPYHKSKDRQVWCTAHSSLATHCTAGDDGSVADISCMSIFSHVQGLLPRRQLAATRWSAQIPVRAHCFGCISQIKFCWELAL